MHYLRAARLPPEALLLQGLFTFNLQRVNVMLPLCCSMVASVAWTTWRFYVFAYACFYDTSMATGGISLPVTNSLSISTTGQEIVYVPQRSWDST
jgi:hypothetical protein